jgi:ABC-2 type transport system ATP-binding protein
MNKIAIRTENLTKKFGDFTAVDHVTFDVKEGEVFGLLGPNGAGKSTTIRILCTLSQPTSGSVQVAGYDVVKEDSEVRRHIGLVSEKLIMYNDLTARENLKLFGKLYDLSDDAIARRTDELLKFVRMEKWADARIGTYSTGMKQRINVIRAMVNQPEILFLDEPTLGLDPQSTVEIREMVRKINVEHGTTIILTTHMMTEADMLCKRIGIIDKGKIVALDTAPNLKKIVTGTDSMAFEFDISNLTPAMMASLRSLGCVVSLVQEDQTRVKVHATGDDSFDSMLDALRSNGARITSAKSLEPTLEDVFLQITGREALDRVSETAKTALPGGPGPRSVRGRVR